MARENDEIDIIHNDGINILIKNTFYSSLMEDSFDGYVKVVPLIDKEENLLYGGSQKNIISTILFFVILNVLYNLSKTFLTKILRHAKQFSIHIKYKCFSFYFNKF